MSSSEAHAVGRQPVNPHDITHIAVVVTSTNCDTDVEIQLYVHQHIR